MPDQNVQEEARQLIIEGRLDEGAKMLLDAWKGKEGAGGPISRLAAGLLRRLATLQKEVVKGVISPAEAELERNRITDGLLYLADRLTDASLEMPPHLAAFYDQNDGRFRFVRARSILVTLVTVLLVVVIFLGWKFSERNPTPEAFDLKVFLMTDEAGQSQAIRGGKIKVKIGDTYLGPEEVGSDGKAVFTALSAGFLDDTVSLFPVELPSRYEVTSQTAWTADETVSRTITFHLARVLDATTWQGIVLDLAGRPVSKAVLEVESAGGVVRDTTGADGRFETTVPAGEGTPIQVVVYVEGRRRADKVYTLAVEGQARIVINE